MTSYRAGGLVPHYSQGLEFYSHEQAKILAETYYKMGSELYYSVIPKLRMDNPSVEDIWRLSPAFVNLSFSCEIILKLFYENDYGKIVRGHKLYDDLFVKLSNDSQKIISDLTINIMKNICDIDYTEEKLINDFRKNQNAFADQRYTFEIIPGKSYELQCSFLIAFSQVLNILSKGLK